MYIRTKDGIYEYLNNSRITETGLWEVATDCGNEGFFGRFRGEVVKQANTIEELCDEFVLIRNGIIRVFPKKQLLDENMICYCINDEVYGSIWTKMGLIYVAKMNDKGELELL